jgi:transposase
MGRPKAVKVKKSRGRCDKITYSEKLQIVAWKEGGISSSIIAKKLDRTLRGVNAFLARFAKSGSYEDAKLTGRPRKTTKTDDQHIVIAMKRKRDITAAKIKEDLGLNIHEQTVRNRIRESGEFQSYWTMKKPWVSEKNRKKRLQWAQEHLNWTEKDWRSVIWSDESPFTLFYNRCNRVWRMPGEEHKKFSFTGTVKHDTKINVWGCFSFAGVGEFCRIIGNMNAPMYVEILRNYLRPSALKLVEPGDDWLFQQDNDPKHTSKAATRYMDEHDIPQMDWPSQSPDLNPIENLWSYLNFQCRHRRAKNEEELFQLLRNSWYDIPKDYLERLVESMPRRCQAVIDCKGNPTKY